MLLSDWRNRLTLKEMIGVVSYFFFWIGYFSYFWFNLFEYNANGDLTVGQANVWADWALHFTMGHAMALRELFLEQSPLLINTGFSYPFAINLISALLLKVGIPMIPAFVIPSYLFTILLVYALYRFLFIIFNNRWIAILGSCLFFFNGGVGFFYFFRDIAAADNGWLYFFQPGKEYTHLAEHHIKWISIVTSTLIPQRSFTMGFALTLLSLGSILKYSLSFSLIRDNKFSFIELLVATIIIGLMPVIHMHSFLAAFVFLACWSISDLITCDKDERINRFRYWMMIAVVASLISIPLLYHYYWGHISGHFVKWYPGWYAKEFKINWLFFWFKNWTLVPLLAVIGLFLILLNSANWRRFVRQLGLHLPALIIFVLINLFLWQPWIWDNTKLLAWVAVSFSGLTAYGLVKLINWKKKNNRINFLLAITIVAGLSFSGVIDIYRNIRFDMHRYIMYTQKELELAEWVRNNTSLDSIWLIGNRHNHWLSNLTGRQVVITYDGWLWSHGYNYHDIHRDRERIFKSADYLTMQRYGINFVVLDSEVLKNNPFRQLLWLKKYTNVGRDGKHLIFRISH